MLLTEDHNDGEMMGMRGQVLSSSPTSVVSFRLVLTSDVCTPTAPHFSPLRILAIEVSTIMSMQC